MSKFLGRDSIRLRLTLVISLVVGVTLIFLSLAVYFSVSTSVRAEIDDDLSQRAAQVADNYSNVSNSLSRNELKLFGDYLGGPTPDPKGAPGMLDQGDMASLLTYLRISDDKGNFLKDRPELSLMKQSGNAVQFQNLIKTGQTYQTVQLASNGEKVRVYTAPIRGRGQVIGYVQAARSLQEVEATSQSFVWPFVIGWFATVAALVLASWWVMRRAFTPIENITQTAYRIGINGDLAERIVVADDSNDEVSRLGRAFNKMLDQLEKTFYAQRQFIADSSHELRTPLTVIRGNLDLLRRNPDPRNQAECIEAIDRESSRMQRLVQDLLLLAQADNAKQTVELVPVQLDTLVLEVFQEGRVLASARHQNFKLTHFEAVQVIGDSDRLKRVLLNLVDNAIKYTPEGGTVQLALYRGKQWARVEVKDTGLGIAKEDQPYIFDRFYRVDKARSRSSGGTGLGLSIVKHIVEAHGGRITLDSEPGQGSTFTVWLHLDPTSQALTDDDDETDSLTPQPQQPVEGR